MPRLSSSRDFGASTVEGKASDNPAQACWRRLTVAIPLTSLASLLCRLNVCIISALRVAVTLQRPCGATLDE